MKQSLQLKFGQQLTMTPQLQQAIRLLQLSTLDLQQEIQEALDSNPMLESDDDDFDESLDQTTESNTQSEAPDTKPQENAETSATEESTPDNEWDETIPTELPVDTDWDDTYQPSATLTNAASADDGDYEAHQSSTEESLQDHLTWQLNLTPLSQRDQMIGLTIIDAIEPSGLLSMDALQIHQGLIGQLEEIEEDEVLAVLHRIQQYDPPGVAAQDLSECLLIQLNQLPEDASFVATAKLIVRNYLIQLGSRDYKLIMRRCRIKENELKQVIELIQTLNPRPGDSFGTLDTEYVIPDVFVTKKEHHWAVNLNPDIVPKLRINNEYASLVKRADTSSENTFLKDNLQEARWLLKSLQSRNETLLKVATSIVEKQRGFLDYGPEAMKPLVLHDIAEAVGMHESTISRVTTQKYMHTPKGIFELKYFFSSHVSTESGGECSSTAIRALIKKLVAAENPQKPLSDSKITTLLADQGIKVARRTIAKYRESIGIPASNERKRLV